MVTLLKMDEVQALTAVALDEDRGGRERLDAFEKADTARKALKVGWSKLGLTVEQVSTLKQELPALAELDANDASLVLIDGDTGAHVNEVDTILGSAPADNPEPELSEQPETSIPVENEPFEASAEELAAQAGRPKSQEELDAEDAQALERAAKKVRKAKETGTGEARGGLTRLVESLLMDPALSYLDIINAVLKDFPKANTSARSIASVAAGMRRAHKDVPMRRPVAKPKIVPVVKMIPVTTEETVAQLEAEQTEHEANLEA